MALSSGRVIRARAVHPRPETVKVTKAALTNIKVGPWNPSEVITQGSGGRPAPMVEETQLPQAEEPFPRSFRMTQELLGNLGIPMGAPSAKHSGEGTNTKPCTTVVIAQNDSRSR